MKEPFVPVPETARFELVYLYDGQFVENVFHVEHPGGWADTDDLTLKCSDFKAWWTTHVKPLQSNTASLVKILATDISRQDGPRLEYVTGLPQSGGNGDGGPLPNHVTVAIKWLTGQRGRSFRGRTYHVGLRAGHINANILVDSFATELRTAYNALLTAVAGTGADHLVIASRKHNGAPRTVGVATWVITASIDTTLDSQRRRLPGRGR